MTDTTALDGVRQDVDVFRLNALEKPHRTVETCNVSPAL
jgi:hypothetical protein